MMIMVHFLNTPLYPYECDAIFYFILDLNSKNTNKLPSLVQRLADKYQNKEVDF